jgi:hypothetical protein
VYHVELRQFPHNMCRFNLSAQELRATILEPWVQDRWVDFGERKWSPHQAKLTVLEGSRIPFAQLTMGRGWRAAQRDGREVTDELLAALGRELERASAAGGQEVGGGATGGAAVPVTARAASEQGGAGVPRRTDVPVGARAERGLSASADDPRAEDLAADSLGLELLARIAAGPAPLRLAWELAGERHPGSPPSATLALAERAVGSLLHVGLIVLLGPRAAVSGTAQEGDGESAARGDGERAAQGEGAPALDASEAERAIAAIGSWSKPGAVRWAGPGARASDSAADAALWMRRA